MQTSSNPSVPPSMRLSELAGQIQQTIEGVFHQRTFWVIADITSHTYKAQSNFHYFELVEKEKASSRILAKIAARAWGNASVNISNFEKATGQQFRNDINVLVQVNVQYSPSFGLQLNLVDIDTNFTLGLFEQQRKDTLARLVSENPTFIQKIGDQYITRNKQLDYNKVIQKIAVISSETSAGYLDFIHTLQSNAFGYKFHLDNYFSMVQGETNAKSIVLKIIEVYQSPISYDALVIIRGGGAQTDFLIFDNYELSRAIAKFPIPVITGIGHQKNETIADLMAHSSTKTPTKAAELVIAHNRRFEESVTNIQKMLLIKTYQIISYQKDRLVQINQATINTSRKLLHGHHRTVLNLSGLILNAPRTAISNRRKDLDNISDNLRSYSRIYFSNKRGYIGHFSSIVKMMSPQNILNKGFAIIKINGKILNNAESINDGMALDIQLASATIHTIVTSKSTHDGNEFDL